jgi:hypothetical protein
MTKSLSPEFTIDWPHGYQTRGGNEARLICSDFKTKSNFSLVFAIMGNTGVEYLVHRNVYGGTRAWVLGGDRDTGDIINKPAPKKKVYLAWFDNKQLPTAFFYRDTAAGYIMHGKLAYHIQEIEVPESELLHKT